MKHIDEIAQALDLDKVAYIGGSWRYLPKKNTDQRGAQIDLLFDREDDAITLCEIKYSDKAYNLDKGTARELIRKMDLFEENFPNKRIPTSKQIFLTMITPFGLCNSVWINDLVDEVVTLEDLFG